MRVCAKGFELQSEIDYLSSAPECDELAAILEFPERAEAPINLCTQPNAHAKPTRVSYGPGYAIVDGYQSFSLRRHSIAAAESDVAMSTKATLLSKLIKPATISKRTVLDIGASSGFYTFWCLQTGASRVTAIDIDGDCVKALHSLKAHFGLDNLRIQNANVEYWQEPADVVFSLALVHWIYSCTAGYGSLDAAIGKLSSLTTYVLIVEWVDPKDPAIAFFRHIDQNPQCHQHAYSFDNFHRALRRHFRRIEKIGDVSPTRSLYAAFKTTHNIDHTCPLPQLYDEDKLIAARKLTTFQEVDYWSRVYDCGDRIIKQGSVDLAFREKAILKRLKSSYFPRVIGASQESTYSILELEKIKGPTLADVYTHDLFADEAAFSKFVIHCFKILMALRQAGVTHRNITPANVIMRDRVPVLIDFGWSAADGIPSIVPESMPKPSDGQACDSYSMGVLLKQVSESRFEHFDTIFHLMTQENASLRVSDPAVLLELAEAASGAESDLQSSERRALTQLSHQLQLALLQYEHLQVQHAQCQLELTESKVTMTALEQQLAQTHSTLVGISDSMAWRLANFLRSIKLKAAKLLRMQ